MGYWECEDAAAIAAWKARWRARWRRLPRWARAVLKVAAWAVGAYLGFVALAVFIAVSGLHP